LKKLLLTVIALSVLCGASFALSINLDPPSIWMSIAPGSSSNGVITIDNNGNEDMLVDAYSQDWVYAKDKSKVFKKSGSTKSSCSEWLVIFPSKFTVPAHGSYDVKYTATVPPSAQGGYYSVLFFESKINDGSSKKSNVILSGRIGSIIYIDTAGRSKKLASISKFNVNEATKKEPFSFDIDIQNQGNTFLTPEGKVIITDKNSKLYGVMDIRKFTILQGESHSVRLTWNGTLNPGEYEVVSTIDCGGDNIVSAKRKMFVTGLYR